MADREMWEKRYWVLMWVFVTYIKVVTRCSRDEAAATIDKFIELWGEDAGEGPVVVRKSH